MISLCLSVLPLLQSQEEIEKLVDRFRSDRIEEREEAFFELKALGVAALPAVRDLARDPDFEIAFRAGELLPQLECRGWIDPRFLELFPGLARRMKRDDAFARSLLGWMPDLARSFEWDEGWACKVFLRGYALSQSFPEEVPAKDLEPMAGPAFREAFDDDEKLFLCGIVESLDFRSALPEIRELAKTGSPSLREAGLTALARLLGAAAIPEIIPFLNDPMEAVRERAFQELKWQGIANAGPLIAFLEGRASVDGRLKALVLLGEAECREALPAIRVRLKDGSADVRRGALGALARVLGKDSRIELEKFLEDPEESVRMTAFQCLEPLEVRNASPAVLGRLRDPSLRVRQQALFALARTGDRSAVPAILPLLKEEGLRQTAIHALGVLDAKEALPEIRRFEDDEDPYVRSQARTTLRRLEAVK